MEFMPHTVYVKTDSDGYINEVNSSEFLTDPVGWTQIDSGHGDRYHHAQGNYFPLPLVTEGGAYRYKLVNEKPLECTAAELRAQEAKLSGATVPTLEIRVKTLETEGMEMKEALEMILSGVVE